MKGKTTFLTKAAVLLFVALFSLTGARAQQTLPFYENFDGEIGAWTVSNTADNTGLYEAGVDGSICFGFAYNTNPPQYLISPEFDGASAMTVSFDYIIRSAYWPETFQVGYSTTTNDVSAFTWSEEVTATNDSEWLTYEENFPAGTKYVAIRYNSYDMYYLYLDNFSFVDPSAPNNLTVSQVTATSANISWTGYADSYNVRYRSAAANGSEYFFEDFENGLDEWTVYTDGEAPNTDGWYTIDPSNSLSLASVSGSYVASAWSWSSNNAYDANNWLVTPKVTFGKKLKFWVRTAAGWPDEYEVLLSTTNNTESSFTVTLQAMAAAPTTDSWELVSIDLSAYAGQEGYIAIHHVSYDCNYLLIDDFGIYDDDIPAGAWTTISATETSAVLTGLNPETEYEVLVQAVYADGVSGWVGTSFTTASATAAPTELAATDVKATSATLEWAGSQESYNLQYRKSTADPTAPATIILDADDVWGDGSGYQLLLDADADTYGVLWDENHHIFVDGIQYSDGDLPATYYDEFEYMIPTDADGALSTTNVVVSGSVTITIPAGTYDYVILNPTPGDKFYIAADNGEVECAGDDFVFEPGCTYHFTMQIFGNGDGAAFELNRSLGEWTVVENVTTPYEFTGLTPETYYEWQVQGVLSDGTTEWSEISSFTTLEAAATVTIGSTGYTTFVAPSDVSFPSDVTAFIVTGMTETAVIMEAVEAIPAGEAVVVKGNPGTYELDAATKTDDVTGNMLLASDGTVKGDQNIYALANKDKGVGFYPVASTVTIPAGKAYLEITSKAREFYAFFEEDDATAIDNLNVNDNLNETIYNLAGQRLNKAQKGINIVNGKKILK